MACAPEHQLRMPDCPCISPRRFTQLMAQLAAAHQGLASEAAVFAQHTTDVRAAIAHLRDTYAEEPPSKLKKLLKHQPLLLQQLAQVSAAALQQFAAQLDRDVETCRTVALLGETLGMLLPLLRGRLVQPRAPATRADASNMATLKDAGFLCAYSSAALAAAKHLKRRQPAPTPAAAAAAPPAAADDSQLFAVACSTLLNVWRVVADWMPALELLSGQSLLLDTVQPTAALIMALARSYADADASGLCGPVLPIALHASVILTQAATLEENACTPQSDAVLSADSVLEVLLLTYGAGLQQLHAQHNGMSQQLLLPSLIAASASSLSASTSSSGGGDDGAAASSTSSSSSSKGCGGKGTSSKGSTKGSKGGSKGSKGGSSSGNSKTPAGGRLAVAPNHRELLRAVLGERQLPESLHPAAAELLDDLMLWLPMAVTSALSARVESAVARALGAASIASRSAAANAVRSRACSEGVVLPWRFVLPLRLAQVELLALAPTAYTSASSLPVLRFLLEQAMKDSTALSQLCHRQLWQRQTGRPPTSLPPLATVKAQAQLGLQATWLQLGPVLLSLCRRNSGEVEVGEEGTVVASTKYQVTVKGPAGSPAVNAREVFGHYSALLMSTLSWQAFKEAAMITTYSDPDFPLVSIAAVLKQEPLLCSKVVEAAVRCQPLDGCWMLGRKNLGTAGTACFGSTIAADFAAELTAQLLAAEAAQAAAAGASSASSAAAAASGSASSSASVLAQQVFCQLVTGLKFAQAVCPAAGSSGSRAAAAAEGAKDEVLNLYMNALVVICATCQAALRILGDVSESRLPMHGCQPQQPAPADAAAVALSPQQQLVWFHLLGRGLIAAAHLLAQMPANVKASGDCVCTTDEDWHPARQFKGYYSVLRQLVSAATRMHSMLQPLGGGGGDSAPAAAAAAAAGTAAAKPAGVDRLRLQAAELQHKLLSLHKLCRPEEFAADGRPLPYDTQEVVYVHLDSIPVSLWHMRAACEPPGELLQQMRSFGVACCAAFPQRGVCGNPACVSLDKFSETANAGSGCTGCNKAVKFCSAACHKVAWKSGHKEACAILKQQQLDAAAAAASEGADEPAGAAA